MTDVSEYVDGEELTHAARLEALRDDVLLGQECQSCGYSTATPAAACQRCGSRDLTVCSLPQEGVVYSETQINVAPPGFEGPYTVALVHLSDDTPITAHVEGTVSIGESVALQGVIEDGKLPAPLFG